MLAMLPTVDVAIICCYLTSVLVVGVALALVKLRREQRRARQRLRGANSSKLLLVGGTDDEFEESEARRGLEDYFLGGRRLPWWAMRPSPAHVFPDSIMSRASQARPVVPSSREQPAVRQRVGGPPPMPPPPPVPMALRLSGVR